MFSPPTISEKLLVTFIKPSDTATTTGWVKSPCVALGVQVNTLPTTEAPTGPDTIQKLNG